MNPHHAVNRRWWDEVTPVHMESAFYDIEGFLRGNNTLGHVERGAVGDVGGKRLLHLQCHFGIDTLSWARLGAEVVGVDFSPVATRQALRLARQTGLDTVARFHELDVTGAGPVCGGAFDVVFTSFGTVVWLADLDGWAGTIADNLADDGFFYFLDAHPAAMIFDESATTPTVGYDYFSRGTPCSEPPGARDYADPDYRVQAPSRQFSWGASEIFAALEQRGLGIFEMREYPFGAWRHFPDMTKGSDGYWYRGAGAWSLPLLLGFKARRCAHAPPATARYRAGEGSREAARRHLFIGARGRVPRAGAASRTCSSGCTGRRR